MSRVDFPLLFHEEKGRKWMVWVIDNEMYRNDGLSKKDFVKKPSCRTIEAKGKNTPHEQAVLEAKRAWIKKLEGGFTPASDDEEGQAMYDEIMEMKNKQGGNLHGIAAKSTKSSSKTTKKTTKSTSSSTSSDKSAEKNEKFGLLENTDYAQNTRVYKALLAEKYAEKKAKVIWSDDEKSQILSKLEKKLNKELALQEFRTKYVDATIGVFVQPKLDGVRCIAYVENGVAICKTRQNKQFVQLEAQKRDIAEFIGESGVVLDGEWYCHEPVVNETLLMGPAKNQFVQACCKTVRKAGQENQDLIEYHVYDIIDDTLNQKERLKFLQKMFSNYDGKYVKPVRLSVARSEEQIDKKLEKFLEQDYEGAMVRDPFGKYFSGRKSDNRSIHLLKYKLFEDAEFQVVDATCAKGTKAGSVVWICETEGGEQFNCEMTGMGIDKTREMYDIRDEYIGKNLTVRYHRLSPIGVPRFPKGIAFRDDI